MAFGFMKFDGLTAAHHAAQQKAGRHCDTHRRYGVVANINAAILDHLLLGIFELLALFAKRFQLKPTFDFLRNAQGFNLNELEKGSQTKTKPTKI